MTNNDTDKKHLMIIYDAVTNEEIAQLVSDDKAELNIKFVCDFGSTNCTYQIFTKVE